MAAHPSTFDSILDTIGGTPTVRLSRIVEPRMAAVYVKLELFNPAGSGKDRIARALIERAEAEGRLQPGGTVIEATTGNTGIGLALVCAAKGYRLVVTMPESMSLERRALLRGYGAKVELTPADQHFAGAVARAKALAAELPGSFMPSQIESPTVLDAHSATTAEELIETVRAEDGRIDAFVAGVGTGGTLIGIARRLREAFPRTCIVAVEPRAGAVLSGGEPGPHRLQGIGLGFVPPLYDRALVDRVIAVEDADAWRARQRLGREEGILVGVAGAASVLGALVLARELGPEARVYTVACDTGERYFSLAERFA